MTPTAITKYKGLLKAREAELVEAFRHCEGITIQRTADTLDEVLLAGECELAIRNLDRDTQLLRAVRSALARIDDGCYGICLNCEEPISPKRLNAVPWASHCLACQDALDRNSLEAHVSFMSVPKAAAA